MESRVFRKETTRTGTAFQVLVNGIWHIFTLGSDGHTRRVTALGGGANVANWPLAEQLAREDKEAFTH